MRSFFSITVLAMGLILVRGGELSWATETNELPKVQEGGESKHPPRKRNGENEVAHLKRISSLERRLEKWHEQGKLTDQEFSSFSSKLAEIKAKAEAAGADQKVTREERKAIGKELSRLFMEMVEAKNSHHSNESQASDDRKGEEKDAAGREAERNNDKQTSSSRGGRTRSAR